MTTFPHYFIFVLSPRSWKMQSFNISFCPFTWLICFSRSSLPQILPLPIHVCILNIDLIFLQAKDHTLSFSLTGGQGDEGERGGRLESLCCHRQFQRTDHSTLQKASISTFLPHFRPKVEEDKGKKTSWAHSGFRQSETSGTLHNKTCLVAQGRQGQTI